MSHKKGRESVQSVLKRLLPEQTAEQKLKEKVFLAQWDWGAARLTELARSLEDESRAGREQLAAVLLLDCAEFLPHKARLFALLAGLLAVRLPNMGALIAELSCARLSEALQRGMWGLATGRLRTVCELAAARVLSYKAVATILRQLVPPSPPRAAVAVLLAVLPFAGRGLAVKEPQVLEAALQNVEGFLRGPTALFSPVYCVFRDEDPAHSSQLHWMWEQVSAMRRGYWEGCQETIPAMSASYDSALEKVQTHLPPAIVNLSYVLRVEEGGQLLPGAPLAKFRLLEAGATEKNCSGADRMVIEGYVVELMRQFSESPEFCAQALQQLPMRFSVEQLVVETVVGELLRLPASEHRPAFYAALLHCMCRGSGGGGGGGGRGRGGDSGERMTRACEAVFDRLVSRASSLDAEARERAADVAALHCANMGFAMPWGRDGGQAALRGDEQSEASALMARAVLARATRLGYWARVERALPADEPRWSALLPPAPDNSAGKSGGGELQDASLDALLPAVLARASTHSLAKLALRQHGAQLRALTASEDAKLQALRIVGSFWASSEGLRLMIVDLLMSAMVVDHLSIVHWVFSEHSASLVSYSPWEILHMAFGKTVAKTEFLRRQNMQAKLEAQLREEKDLFLTTFQRFVMVLESNLASSGASAGQENNWFKTVLAQMQAFARRYRSSIQPFMATLDAIVFSDDCEPRIRSAFKQAVSE